MSTPPPPKPWETTTAAAATARGVAPATSKDTPLAPGDAIKPWDVPGAGEMPSGEKNRELSFFDFLERKKSNRPFSLSLSLCVFLPFSLFFATTMSDDEIHIVGRHVFVVFALTRFISYYYLYY
jgi:hypothetical protein